MQHLHLQEVSLSGAKLLLQGSFPFVVSSELQEQAQANPQELQERANPTGAYRTLQIENVKIC